MKSQQMNRVFILVSCLAPLVLATSAFADAKPLTLQQEFKKRCDEIGKLRKTARVDAFEALRREEKFATNVGFRVAIDLSIVGVCRCGGMWGLDGWDVRLGERTPSVVQRDLDDPEVKFSDKVKLGKYLAEYYAGAECYADADRVLRLLLADAKCKPHEKAALHAELHAALSDNYRWQDRFTEAWDELDRVSALNPGLAAGKAARLMLGDGNRARAEKLLANVRDPFERMQIRRSWTTSEDEKRKLAFDFVMTPTNNPVHRAMATAYCLSFELTPESRRALGVVKGLAPTTPKTQFYSQHFFNPVESAYARGDWELLELIFDTFKDGPLVDMFDRRLVLRDPSYQLRYMVALAANGKRDAALEVAATNLVNKKTSPKQKAQFEIYRAIVSDGDVLKTIDATGLKRSETQPLVIDAISVAFALKKDALAEKLGRAFEARFFRYGQREMKVAFSKDRILSVSDWRKIRPTLDRQLCDRTFGVDLDALVTDVATRRELVKTTDRDSKNARMEVSSVCDTHGLHIFLCVEDPKAREVEAGFAGGIGTEMYFAPGKDTPYVCMGSDPRNGVSGWGFQTAYSSRLRGPIELSRDNGAFRQETAFTDTDYVLHLFFAWDSFYRTMPKDGSRWRFECLAFGPDGANSLGGSRSIHNSSKFCDLVFSFKPAELTAIRRALLYRTAKSWRGHGRMDRFDRWGDVAVGDEEFREKVLRPIEKELDGYAKKVTYDMTDADVNLVFEKAYPRWKGIAHEIDALRGDWLRDKMFK